MQARKMLTLPLGGTNYYLLTILNAALAADSQQQIHGSATALSYFTPGSDYATPNTDAVSVGGSVLASAEDGLLVAPGVRWDEPAPGMGAFIDLSQIIVRTNGATANQRLFVIVTTR